MTGGISLHAVDVASGRPALGMTVEVVGASPCGQASLACGRASTRSALVPSVLSGFDVTAISGTANRRE